jgi:hypothetical protein
MKHLCTRFGLNYAWGLMNFTLGVTLGGIVVAVVLIGAMPSARAGRAPHGAAARLHHPATIAIAGGAR